MAAGEIILKVVNASAVARQTDVHIDGVSGLKSQATAHVIAAGLDDTNSFANPDQVVPVSRSVVVSGTSFQHTFPPHSLTVLRLRPLV